LLRFAAFVAQGLPSLRREPRNLFASPDALAHFAPGFGIGYDPRATTERAGENLAMLC
jgi:hypothetical protein